MIKMKSLLNEKLTKTTLRKLPRSRTKPKSIIALRIKRVERGGGEVTNQELINIFKSPDFPKKYRTSDYVYYVELKKSKDNKRVAIVNIFQSNNLPDNIKLTDPVDFELDGAKVYLEIPDAIRYRKADEKPAGDGGAGGAGGAVVVKIGDEKMIDDKLHTWDGTQWVLKTGTSTGNGNNNSDQNAKIVPAGTPVLKRGSRGESVKQLQTLLGLTGDSVDAKFGGETAAWLMIWQEEHKLTADGIYGPKTAAAMKKDPIPVKDQERAKRLAIKLKNQKPPVVPPIPEDPGIKTANFYKQLETKFPKIFKGTYTFKLPGGKVGDTVYRVNFGDGNQQAKTYEAAIKRNVTGATNTDEDRVLDLFSKLSKQQLTTLLKRYQKINGSNLALDLKKNAFDESEMTKLENIFLKKGLNLASFMGSGAGASF